MRVTYPLSFGSKLSLCAFSLALSRPIFAPFGTHVLKSERGKEPKEAGRLSREKEESEKSGKEAPKAHLRCSLAGPENQMLELASFLQPKA